MTGDRYDETGNPGVGRSEARAAPRSREGRRVRSTLAAQIALCMPSQRTLIINGAFDNAGTLETSF